MLVLACDGYSERFRQKIEGKTAQEALLLEEFRKVPLEARVNPLQVARFLADCAKDGSGDNISVIASQISVKPDVARLIGVNDGHGGAQAAIRVAYNLADTFRDQCALTPEAYAAQALSVHRNRDVWMRDNALMGDIPAAAASSGAASSSHGSFFAPAPQRPIQRLPEELEAFYWSLKYRGAVFPWPELPPEKWGSLIAALVFLDAWRQDYSVNPEELLNQQPCRDAVLSGLMAAMQHQVDCPTVMRALNLPAVSVLSGPCF